MKSQTSAKILLVLAMIFGAAQGRAEDAAKNSTPASPVSPADPASNYILCKLGKEVRTIRVEKKGGSCKSFYTKDGVDQSVGQSSGVAVCQKVINKIRVNLEKGDWKCKDVSQARVSSSAD